MLITESEEINPDINAWPNWPSAFRSPYLTTKRQFTIRHSHINRGQRRPKRTERNGNEKKPNQTTLTCKLSQEWFSGLLRNKSFDSIPRSIVSTKSFKTLLSLRKKFKTWSTLLTCPKEMWYFLSTEHTLARTETKRHPKNRPAT